MLLISAELEANALPPAILISPQLSLAKRMVEPNKHG